MANQIIDHPTLGSIEFPDTMSDADIVSAIKRLEATEKPAAPISKPAPTPEAEPGWFMPGSKSEAVVRGASQGATLGFGDEIQAGLRAAGAKITGDKRPFTDIYSYLRDNERDANKKSAAANPTAYTTGNLVASAPALIATGGTGATVKGGAALGGAYGFGSAEGSMTDQLKDTATGAALGGAVSKVAAPTTRAVKATATAAPTAAKAAIKAGTQEASEWTGVAGAKDLLGFIGKAVKGEEASLPLGKMVKPAIAHGLGPAGYAVAGTAVAGKGVKEGLKAGAAIYKEEMAKTATETKPLWAKVMEYVKQAKGPSDESKTAQELFKLNQTSSEVRKALNK